MGPLVFLVDDEADLVWTTVRMLRQRRASWTVEGFSDPARALASFATRAPDLLVTDVRMPGVDGLELVIRLRQARTGAAVIITSAWGEERARAMARDASSVRYLEKPVALDALLATADELLDAGRGFRGHLDFPELADLVQMQAMARGSGRLQVQRGASTGCIWFQQGDVVHATCDGRTGVDAFHDLLAWPGGRFRMDPFTAPVSRTITQGTMELLMDSLRLLDEGRRAAAG